VKNIIKDIIIQKGEPIGFDEFMELALYHPKYGYYRSSNTIIGGSGDFTTAPEISPLFGWTIAKHCQEVFQNTDKNILEFGAGSGALAIQIMQKIPELKKYYILEVSASLKQLQFKNIKQQLPESINKVVWLKKLPNNFEGIIIANEVLDALPTKRFEFGKNNYELKVSKDLEWVKTTTSQTTPINIPAFNYQTEINFMIKPWLKSLVDCSKKAHILLIDYGYNQNEYYHPQRTTGTLRCYHNHKATDNPFEYIGHQDITSSVNFSLLANIGTSLGLELTGWTTQAHFLINLGIEQFITEISDEYLRIKLTQQLKQLILPTAMGETFKMIGFNKNLSLKYQGFTFDLSHKL